MVGVGRAFRNVLVLPLAPVFLIPAFLSLALSFVSPPLAFVAAAPGRLALNSIVSVALLSGRWEARVPRPDAAAYLLFLAALPFFSRYCLAEPEKRRLAGAFLLAASLALWLAE